MLEDLKYRAVSALLSQPRLVRGLARVARGLSWPIPATMLAVRDTLDREIAFTHGAYSDVMEDGPFVIGLPSGPDHDRQREMLTNLLPSSDEVAKETAAALPALVMAARDRLGTGDFDLIEHYMMPLAWRALRLAYGAGAASQLEAHASLLTSARWLGAQLIVGKIATTQVRQRAQRAAADLDALFGRVDAALHGCWRTAFPATGERRRNAAGLLWVGHPAITQAGALIFQELMERPTLYRKLCEKFSGFNLEDVASCPSRRAVVRDQVLELLRFRPPFPILLRSVPRPASFPTCPHRMVPVKPTSIAILGLGALFDPSAQREAPGDYVAGRHFANPEDRTLMFGSGRRYCIARDQVQEILVSALIGLLALSRDSGVRPLRYATPIWRACRYDGPVLVQMRLRY